jgi:hypothetical protein
MISEQNRRMVSHLDWSNLQARSLLHSKKAVTFRPFSEVTVLPLLNLLHNSTMLPCHRIRVIAFLFNCAFCPLRLQ